jgi:LPXTG-site transpeptidase (sortase) family protein
MKKNAKRNIAVSITLLALLVFGLTLVHAAYNDFSPTEYIASTLGFKVTQADSIPLVRSPLQPARLEIPSLMINAAVQYTTTKANGSMGTPTNFVDVAWYKSGPAPGQIGSAVIDGHVDNGLALAGVFKHLKDIKVGDAVYVVTNAGTKLTFVVNAVNIYPYNTPPPTNIFSSGDNLSHLNLITCTGDWVAQGKTYNERLVVYTTLVQQ